MDLKVRGPACAHCRALEKGVNRALDGLDNDAVVSKAADYGEIASWGVMGTAALVVDDQVVIAGRVPTVAELAALLGTGS